jgi:hypothetical protein
MHTDMNPAAMLACMGVEVPARPRWQERLKLLVSGYRAEAPQAQEVLATALGRDQSWVSRAGDHAPTAETIAQVCTKWPEGRLSADYFFAPGPAAVDRHAFLVRSHQPPEALARFLESAQALGYGIVSPDEQEALAEQRWPLGKPTPKSYGDLLSALRACEPHAATGNGQRPTPSGPPEAAH